MTLRALLLPLVLVVAGCVSAPTAPKLMLPAPKQATYSAPDGRVWVRYDSAEKPDSSYYVSYTPEPTAFGKFTEMLSFSIKPGHSVAAEMIDVDKGLRRAKEVFPKMEYTITKAPDGFSYSCNIPERNDRTITKAIATAQGVASIGYECRSAADAANHVEFWSEYLHALTAQSFSAVPATSVAAPR